MKKSMAYLLISACLMVFSCKKDKKNFRSARYLDKLVDELVKGRKMEEILRGA